MINCRTCINWIDESLEEIEANHGSGGHVFQGCRIFGYVENDTALQSCEHYLESANLYAVCGTCRLTAPKVCISFRECVNCTDTDLFCVEQCIGGEIRRYCSHSVRLHSQGVQLIDEERVFDLFPTLDMPPRKKPQD